ncbi:MAG: hypothetical protein LBG27_14545 [Spirochaetaceae bacterium]|jgi:hypothetical protein|nr:hypothetical protein [Spirochaetaceae bacterium]
MGLTLQQKQALTGRRAHRCRQPDKKTKSKIPDEFVQAAGYNRKYAPRPPARWGKDAFLAVDGKPVKLKAGAAKRRQGGGRKPVCGPEGIESRRRIRAFFRRRRGKLPAPLIREQMSFFQAWPDFRITPAIRDKLLKTSPAAIGRALKEDRKKRAVRGIGGTKPGKLLKKHISARTCYPWNERKRQTSLLGFFEIDTVRHCGGRDSGEFCLALDAAGAASGRTELRPLLNKAQKWVLEARQDIHSRLPFPLLGIDSGNGPEFIKRGTFALSGSVEEQPYPPVPV